MRAGRTGRGARGAGTAKSVRRERGVPSVSHLTPSSRPASRAPRPVPFALFTLLLLAVPAAAQQPVLLELRPRVGDTLHVRLDQQVEMSGTTRRAGADSTMTVTTTMRLLTSCVVERADAAGATVRATADSVSISSTGERAAETERARRSLQGRSVRLRIAPDGSAELVGDGGEPAELRALFTQMPATLPPRPVAVGESWTRTMEVPRPDAEGDAGTLTATFRLDSLGRGGDVAYVTMRGSLGSAAGRRRGAAAATVEMSGVVVGSMTIDRRRGWMTDARTTLSVRSVVAPPPGTSGAPTHVRLKMTQWLRTK